MKKSRNITLWSLLLVLAMIAVACGGRNQEPAEEPVQEVVEEPTVEVVVEEPTVEVVEEPTEEMTEFETNITVWADDTRAPILNDLAEAFQNEYGVGLIVEQVADIDDQFPIAAPAGQGPDIVLLAHDRIGGFYESGLLAPLDLGDKTDDFHDVAIDAFTFNGELVGMPYTIENMAFFYNTDLVESPPVTWDEAMEIGADLVDSGDATFAIALTGTTYDMFPLQTAFGGYIFGNDGSGYDPNDVGIDSDGMIEAGQFVQDNIEAGLISDSADWDTAHALFEGGEVPFLMAGPWALDRLRESGVPYAIASFPEANKEGQPFLGVWGFSVNALSDNVLLAQAFLTEFVATEEVMQQLADSGNRPSAFIAVGSDDPDLAAFGDAGTNALPMPAIPEMGSVWGSWGDAFTLIMNGEQDAEDALSNAGLQIRALIAGEEMPVVEDEPAMIECEVDLTGETLTVYQQAGREGPLAAILGQGFAYATEDAISYINDNGGICGAELDFVFGETNYDVEQEISVYEQFRVADPKPFVLMTYGSAATVALKDRVVEDEIVNFAAGLNAEAIYNPANGYTVGLAPIYSDQFAGYAQWLTDNWDDIKPEGAEDDIVIGVVGWPNAFGAGATTPEAIAYAESIGVTVLDLEEAALSPDADVSGAIQNLLLQGANVIYNQSLSFTVAQVVGTVRALGVWDSVIVGGVNWSMHDDVPTFLGENPELMDGYCGMMPYNYWSDTDVPGVQLATEVFDGSGRPEADRSTTYLTTFAQFLAIRDAATVAVNTVGSADITGADFLAALESMGEIDSMGIGTYNVTADGVRSPRQSQVRCIRWDGEQLNWEVEADWFELPNTAPTGG